MRILVAEDDKGVASFLKQGLKEAGYAVDARSYGGDIKVESEPGQLTTFTVSLPLVPN